ncbi:zinc ABC transporter substrate-binding protein [Ruegeria pomeroyi]|nr:zinc ABC transporter substrate-binding protein [Ruegeria pomeroyi]
MNRLSLSALMMTCATPLLAEVPQVAVDIAPVHSLVAQLMAGVGEPDLIVRPGASPHGYALRPSEARAVQQADLVVWMGEELTPWLEKPLSSLSGDARHIALLEQPATARLGYRDLAHDDHEDHDDHDDHKEHADHETQGDKGHDDHAQAAHDDHDGDHDHSGTDPHAWLDPGNASVWLSLLAEELAGLDPDHADRYRANAAEAQARLAELTVQIAAELQPMQGKPFIAFHDAYQYFERPFGLTLAGTVSLGDASSPSPARLAHLREEVVEEGVTCAFSEPQYNTALLETAVEGTGAAIFVLDPLGAGLEPGPELYPQVLRDMAASFAACAAR